MTEPGRRGTGATGATAREVAIALPMGMGVADEVLRVLASAWPGAELVFPDTVPGRGTKYMVIALPGAEPGRVAERDGVEAVVSAVEGMSVGDGVLIARVEMATPAACRSARESGRTIAESYEDAHDEVARLRALLEMHRIDPDHGRYQT